MTETVNNIIRDAEIERVHANANFGSMPKRRVVDEGVLKYAFGYSSGSTQLSILLEHGLIRKPKPGRYGSVLTVKGQRYLRAMKGLTTFDDILNLMGR
jgi:hypothetical protein